MSGLVLKTAENGCAARRGSWGVSTGLVGGLHWARGGLARPELRVLGVGRHGPVRIRFRFRNRFRAGFQNQPEIGSAGGLGPLRLANAMRPGSRSHALFGRPFRWIFDQWTLRIGARSLVFLRPFRSFHQNNFGLFPKIRASEIENLGRSLWRASPERGRLVDATAGAGGAALLP